MPSSEVTLGVDWVSNVHWDAQGFSNLHIGFASYLFRMLLCLHYHSSQFNSNSQHMDSCGGLTLKMWW